MRRVARAPRTWPPRYDHPLSSYRRRRRTARAPCRATRTGDVSCGRAYITRLRLRDEPERDVLGRGRDRDADRAIALAAQPIFEIVVIEPNDAADLEYRQGVSRLPRHVTAPALRPAKRSRNSLPGLDEIRHIHSSVCPSHRAVAMPRSDHLGNSRIQQRIRDRSAFGD